MIKFHSCILNRYATEFFLAFEGFRKTSVTFLLEGVTLNQKYHGNLRFTGSPNPMSFRPKTFWNFCKIFSKMYNVWVPNKKIPYHFCLQKLIWFGLLMKRIFQWYFWLSVTPSRKKVINIFNFFTPKFDCCLTLNWPRADPQKAPEKQVVDDNFWNIDPIII